MLVLLAAQDGELALKPMARFVSYATAGVPPEIMGIANPSASLVDLRDGVLCLEFHGIAGLHAGAIRRFRDGTSRTGQAVPPSTPLGSIGWCGAAYAGRTEEAP